MASKAGTRWANVPVPEPHVVGLLGGLALHAIRPWRVYERSRRARAAGWLCITLGLAGIAWAVRAVGTQALSQPEDLVTTGPYAVSRNPMYVAWTVLYVGIALVTNVAWLFVVLPAVLAGTHHTVETEERLLEHAFGDAYRDYRRSVPRYR